LRTTSRAWPVLLLLPMVLAACSADGAPDGPDEVTVDASDEVGRRPDVSGVLAPDRGAAPDDLVIVDVVVGAGDLAEPGATLTVHYEGLRWSDGGTFDSSWDRGQPFSVMLGAGRVIPGWEVGLDGMRVGGRRILTIPPGLAYGDRGAGSVIGPGETLVFVVDLIAVDPPA
jgi:peptidylprolyl isomerase